MGTPSDDGSLIWLLRRSVRRYRGPIADSLREAGFDDLPQQGIWALSILSRPEQCAGDLVARMEITKQAVSQLVDVLAAAAYVKRRDDPNDRRRTILQLTGRGLRAVEIIDRTITSVESDIAARIGHDELADFHRILEAFVAI